MKNIFLVLLGAVVGAVGVFFYQVLGKPALPTYEKESIDCHKYNYVIASEGRNI
jgi:hypothetical protein